MEKFDVIIVGAGPGGLRCAEILSKSDKKVLLLEKNPKIGPKVCAGGLSRKSFSLLGSPQEIVEHISERAIFNSPKSRSILEFGCVFGYTVRREKLGEWQLEKIKNSSVAIKTDKEVAEIRDNKVVLKSGEVFKYNYLIGADGSNSIVRKFLNIPIERLGVGFQYIIPRKFPDVEIFFDSSLFNSWYSWIFPYQDCASIGVGCFPKIVPANLVLGNFKKWASEKNIDLSQGKFEAFPINCDYRGFHFGNIFLVGDAAGFASGFTGEGIYQALVSGEEVANIILNPLYNPKKIREIRREVQVHHLMLRIVWLSGPFRNKLFDLITYSVRNKFIAKALARILT